MNNNLDIYIYIIVALMPLTASLVVLQVNPYHALAMRGILGAIAALVYTILGAPDVALTEALVGTLLAITLYAVAVRSSLVMRLGFLEDEINTPHEDPDFQEIVAEFRRILNKRHMRLEITSYTDKQALERAFFEKEIHASCSRQLAIKPDDADLNPGKKSQLYTQIRIQHLHNIMQAEFTSSKTVFNYINVADISGSKLEEQRL